MANPDLWRSYTEKMVRKWTTSTTQKLPTHPPKTDRPKWTTTWFGIIPAAIHHAWRVWRNK